MLANQLVYREDEAHLVVQEDNSSKNKGLEASCLKSSNDGA